MPEANPCNEVERQTIRRLNYLSVFVVFVLLFVVLAGAILLLAMNPTRKLQERFTSVEDRLSSLESKLEVAPSDVFKEVQELKSEIKKLKPPPASATNDN